MYQRTPTLKIIMKDQQVNMMNNIHFYNLSKDINMNFIQFFHPTIVLELGKIFLKHTQIASEGFDEH